MRRFVFLTITILLLSTGCNKQAQAPSGNGGGKASSAPSADSIQNTTDWKVYSNTQNGFEIKYPASWQVQNSASAGASFMDPQLPNINRIDVYASDIDEENMLRGDHQITGSSTIQILGVTAKKLTGESAVSGRQSVFVIIPHNGKFYTVITPVEIADQVLATFTFSDNTSQSGQFYENEFMRVSVPAGWVAKQAVKTMVVGSCVTKQNCTQTVKTEPNPAAVNITKGKYVLYINVQASQASGVQGGRFAEIAMGAPSADAVVTEQPSECGQTEYQSTTLDHQRVDLYVGPQDKRDWCAVPGNGSTVWFFSYITDKGKGYFNYYNPDGSGPTGYVITMAYDSKNVNGLPAKGSKDLDVMLKEMTAIANSLEIKKH